MQEFRFIVLCTISIVSKFCLFWVHYAICCFLFPGNNLRFQYSRIYNIVAFSFIDISLKLFSDIPEFKVEILLCFVYKNSLIAKHLFSFVCIVYENNRFYFDWFILRHVVMFLFWQRDKFFTLSSSMFLALKYSPRLNFY